MKNFFTGLFASKVVVVLSVATALWIETASAAQSTKLGFAETVSGGELILVEEKCTFQGLGTGYNLYLTNPRGSPIGKGCAMTDALPPELGAIMVQWGASPVRGAESYQIDDFTWTPRGRAVMAPVLKARYETNARMKAKEYAEAKEKASDAAMVAAFNNPNAKKIYFGSLKSNKTYGKYGDAVILITPKPCSLLVEVPNLSSESNHVMEWNNNGRKALELTLGGDKIGQNGCALPNADGSITVKWAYKHEKPENFTSEEIKWEPKGQEWIGAKAAKGN